jgi:hypothetical protein
MPQLRLTSLLRISQLAITASQRSKNTMHWRYHFQPISWAALYVDNIGQLVKISATNGGTSQGALTCMIRKREERYATSVNGCCHPSRSPDLSPKRHPVVEEYCDHHAVAPEAASRHKGAAASCELIETPPIFGGSSGAQVNGSSSWPRIIFRWTALQKAAITPGRRAVERLVIGRRCKLFFVISHAVSLDIAHTTPDDVL